MADDDCMECGACCFSTSDTYVSVTPQEAQRLVALSPDAVREFEGAYYLTMRSGRCAGLEAFGDSRWRGFICTYYSVRPLPCRQLKRGSPACLAERSDKLRFARRHLPVV